MLTCSKAKPTNSSFKGETLNKWVENTDATEHKGPLNGFNNVCAYIRFTSYVCTPMEWSVSALHHHKNTKWGKIFWYNKVDPSGRVPWTSDNLWWDALKLFWWQIETLNVDFYSFRIKRRKSAKSPPPAWRYILRGHSMWYSLIVCYVLQHHSKLIFCFLDSSHIVSCGWDISSHSSWQQETRPRVKWHFLYWWEKERQGDRMSLKSFPQTEASTSWSL